MGARLRSQRDKRLSHSSWSRSSKSTTTVILDGVTAECRVGPYSFQTSFGPALGLDGDAPSPGGYVRGALGACLAIGYAMEFARRELEVQDIQVNVETESDARGAMTGDPELVGFLAMRYTVEIETDADQDAIREAIEFVDRASPLLNSFVRPIPAQRELVIGPKRAAAE